MGESCERGRYEINGLRSRRSYDKDFAAWLSDLSVGRNLHLNVADLVHFHNKLILKRRLEKSWSERESETHLLNAHILHDMEGLDYASYEPLSK